MLNRLARHLLGVSTLLAVPGTLFGSGFPIATSAEPEYSADAASDGTNFLVSVQDETTTGARLVSPAGAVLTTVTAPIGDAPLVVFDGTNYLLVWAEFSNAPSGTLRGLRVDRQGAAIGSPFLISQSTTVREANGVAFDGTNYLVTWTDRRREVMPPQPGDKDIYGRFVSAAGAPVGSDFKISGVSGKDSSVAFSSPHYLVTWSENYDDLEVRARFVSPGGVLQTEFTVNDSTYRSDTATRVVAVGENFLVVWSDEVDPATGNLDLFAQLVSPSGALVGPVIPVTTAPGPQLFPYIAFDGANVLVTWTDLSNDANGNFGCDPGEGSCADVSGQLISASGALVGTNFVVTADAGSQGQSPTAFGAGRYFVAWTTGFDTSNSDVEGTFLASDGVFRNGFE